MLEPTNIFTTVEPLQQGTILPISYTYGSGDVVIVGVTVGVGVIGCVVLGVMLRVGVVVGVILGVGVTLEVGVIVGVGAKTKVAKKSPSSTIQALTGQLKLNRLNLSFNIL